MNYQVGLVYRASRREGASMTSQFKDKSVLITGGTGSFGKHMTKTLLNETDVRRVIVFSRDELKQFEMQQEYAGENRLRFFIGNVRERDRLLRAFDGVDLVIHAAALKQVPAAEYNPFEAIKTNILGASNVIDAAIDRGIKKVVALSTDKASSPINLYGATKLVSDKLFVSGNAYAGKRRTRFAVVRYGNVVGSRGSVVPLFRTLAAKGVIPITDDRMTRFWITLDQGVRFVINAFSEMQGGEVFVPKIPSMKVVDLAKAMAPNAKINIVGIRPGEKLHEEMISETDARRTLDVGDHYVIQPEFEWWNSAKIEGKELPEGFRYSSDNTDDWLDIPRLQAMVNG